MDPSEWPTETGKTGSRSNSGSMGFTSQTTTPGPKQRTSCRGTSTPSPPTRPPRWTSQQSSKASRSGSPTHPREEAKKTPKQRRGTDKGKRNKKQRQEDHTPHRRPQAANSEASPTQNKQPLAEAAATLRVRDDNLEEQRQAAAAEDSWGKSKTPSGHRRTTTPRQQASQRSRSPSEQQGKQNPNTAARHRGTRHTHKHAPRRRTRAAKPSPAGRGTPVAAATQHTSRQAAAGRRSQTAPPPPPRLFAPGRSRRGTQQHEAHHPSVHVARGLVRYRLQLYLTTGHTPITWPPILPVGPTMAIVYQSMPAGIWLAASVRQMGHSPPYPPYHDGATVVASKQNPLDEGHGGLHLHEGGGPLLWRGTQSMAPQGARGTKQPQQRSPKILPG